MKKYLLFDLDGTLTDPGVGITTCVQYALKAFGIEEPDLNKLTPFIGPPLKESFKEFYHMDDEQAWKAVEKYRERFDDVGIFENEVYKGIPEMLRLLQSKGFYLAVASSKPTVSVERILEHFDLRKYFCVVVGSELDGTRVNKEEVVMEALNRLFSYKPIQYSQVYMIGDRKFDVEGAKALGVESVGVTYGYGDIEELKVAKADYIVRSVEELQNFLMREVKEVKPEETVNKSGFNFRKIWAMLYYFLMFMLVRNVVMYAVDSVCTLLWGGTLPAALDSFLFVRDGAGAESSQIHFTGNQTTLRAMLGFLGGTLFIRKDAMRVIKKAAEDNKLRYLRKEGKLSYLLIAGATVGAAIGLNLVMELTHALDASATYQAVVADQYSASFLVGLLAYGVVSPIGEELLFRGIIYNLFKRDMRVKEAMIFSSALFGFYHMNYVQGVYGFLMGCLIIYAYEYFGSFKMAIAVHMLANILVYCLTYTPLVVSGFVSWPVCIIFGVLAAVCLWTMGRKKDVY